MSNEMLWSTKVDGLARAAASELAAVLTQLRDEREKGRPAATDRLAGSAEKLARCANSLQVTAQRMRESEEALREQQARLEYDSALLLSEVIGVFIASVGVGRGGASGEVLGTLLRQAGRGEELVLDSEAVERLRQEVRGVLLAQPEAEAREAPEPRAPLELPVPRPTHPDGAGADRVERDRMVGPRRGWKPVDAEVVDAEVVAPAPARSLRRGTQVTYRSDGQVEVDGIIEDA
jgi:hypothetical protein